MSLNGYVTLALKAHFGDEEMEWDEQVGAASIYEAMTPTREFLRAFRELQALIGENGRITGVNPPFVLRRPLNSSYGALPWAYPL